MGYYTEYALDLVLHNNLHSKEEIVSDLRKSNEYAEGALNADGTMQCEHTWYKCEEDFSAFSKKYPDILFILFGEGQSYKDKWKCYFKNGKYKKIHGELDFEPFSPEKLSERSSVRVSEESYGVSYFLSLQDSNGKELDEDSDGKEYLDIIKDMRKSFNGANYALTVRGYFIDEYEWFHHQVNLLDFSKKYPQILFIIGSEPTGAREDGRMVSRLWRKYFRDGKLQVSAAFWSFDDFNEDMLR